MDFKLTSSQMNFYTKNVSLDSSIWNQGVLEVFPKVYSYKQLNDAYNRLVEDNDSLRVKIKETENGPVTYLEDFEYVEWPFIQVNSDEELMLRASDFINSQTDPYGQLVRCIIFQTPTTSGVLICAHHIVVDGYSAFVMSEHINQYIQDLNYTPPAQQSYYEYIEREDKHKKSKRFLSDREFWKKQFEINPVSDLFSSQNNIPDFTSSEIDYEIPYTLLKKVKTFCKDNEISPATFFNTVYATYIHRTFDVERFTIGVPVLNRTTQAELNTVGLYMHIVPLVVNLQSDSFLANAVRIEDSWMNIFRHQKFTQQDIKEMLKEENIPVNTLFDFTADFLEFEPNKDYKTIITYINSLTIPLEFHLHAFSENNIALKTLYQTALFTEKEINSMLKSIVRIAEFAVDHAEESIVKIPLYSIEEINKAMEFSNGLEVALPENATIHTRFEENAKKKPDEKAIIANDKTLTYRELNEEANRIANGLIEKGVQRGDIVAFCLERKSYVFSAIMGILKTGATYLPIDMNYPIDRKEFMLSDSKAKYCITEENIAELLSNKGAENPNVSVNGEDICYCIYTSGSTGKPKGTLITHRNAVNLCYDGESSMYRGVYASCQTICSMASLGFDMVIAETLVPLLNGMTIVFANENESKMPRYAKEMFEKNKIDVFQSTPTKLQLFIEGGVCLDNVKKIIVGGERLEPAFFNRLQKSCNAKIFNFYGPTETTVWSSFAEVTDAEDIHIGTPIANTQIYIVDKYLNPVPIGVVGELCIAGDGVCAGYLNRPELTNEKFIDNPFREGKLYKTGDLATLREDGNIKFVGRNDFQVKIRGLRIELGEIENAVASVDGVVQSAVVVRKDNESRDLICAFYTGEEKEAKELRTILSASLPKYMVPHIFTHMEKMPLTSSGKINRNNLPQINLNNISTEIEYVAPTTEEEKILVDAIETVLDCNNTSILDNFFDMGGDSLKAIELTAELEDKGYTVNVKSIFDSIDIQALAQQLTVKTTEEQTVEYASVLPATATQMTVYTAQMIDGNSTLYNLSYIFKTDELNIERLQNATNKLIERHESLRTHFENRDGQIVQVINEKATVEIEQLENDIPTDFFKPFNLTKAPLLRIGCYENTVMIDLHHIIADGSSVAIFFKELNELYMGRELKHPVEYGEFAVTYTYTEADEAYWLKEYEEVPSLELVADFPKPEAQSFNGTNDYSFIDNGLHENILSKCKELGITPYAYYMACYNILLSKYSGNEDISVGTPISGRSSKYLNTMGMFVNMISLRNQPTGTKTFVDFVNEVKEKSIEAINHQKYPQHKLIKKTNNKKTIYDVMFAYQSEEMTDIVLGDKKAEVLPTPMNTAKCDLSFYVLPRENEIVLMTEYCTDIFKEETVQKFISSYNNILVQCLDETKQIKDISVTNEEEKELLKEFNNTPHTYNVPENSTIYSLFEEKAKDNKEKVCVTANGKNMTYGELLSIAETLDSEIRKITENEKSIIAVICERSLEMYGAIYGIIRGGNAYLPIDPNYPQDRIEYILKNSNAKAVVAQGKFTSLAGETKCIDMTEFIANTPNNEKLPCKAEENDAAYVIYTSGSTGKPKGAKISHKSAVNRILWMHDKYPLNNDDVILQKTPYTFDVSVWELFWWGMVGASLAASKPDEHFLPAKILEETEKNKVTHLHFVPSVFDIFLTYLENNPNERDKFNTVKYVFLSGEALTANSISRFYKMFDYEKITLHNLYGPTECAVDVSYYDCVPTDIDPVPIGKPIYNTQLHIVDKYLNPTPIGVVGELCIAGINVGQGYLNNPELTNEKFIDNPFGEGKLYKTGDLAYWRNDGQICYVGRNDFQVKINGQRIELGEIENAITGVDGVVQCTVIVKKDNDNGQFICAFYTGNEIDSKELRSVLSTKLPRYMVPHTFTHIEEMPLTSSGKINRNALPQIDLTNISTEIEYVAPNTQEEKALADVVCSVLRINSVTMLDNFFHLGGDSISSIYVVSELEEMGYELHVADIMQSDTLLDVAKAMKSTSNKSIYNQGEVNGFIPFSPIMRAYLNENNSIQKDFVHTCIISVDCDEDTARKALDVLISYHDILRGTFTNNGIEVYPSNEREVYSFKAITIDDTDKAKEYLNNNIRIDDDKLINVVFCKTEKESLVSITIHHFLIDLVSWEVLMKDFTAGVNQLKNNEEISLPAKTASFMMWSDELGKYFETISHENKGYWRNIEIQLDNTKSLYSREENENEAEKYSFAFDKDISDKLINEANNTYGTRTNEVLLTALGLAAGKIADGSVGIIVESHGRAELHHPITIERTIGWFTSCYPVVINNNNNVTDELINTKETLRRIPKNGIDYLLLSRGFHTNTDIIFNFYQNNIANENRENKLIAFNSDTSVFPGKINVDCSVTDNILTVNISVPKCKHKLQISEELGMEFKKQIKKIIDICTTTDTVIKTRSDFSDDELTESELDELKDLFDWTDDNE